MTSIPTDQLTSMEIAAGCRKDLRVHNAPHRVPEKKLKREKRKGSKKLGANTKKDPTQSPNILSSFFPTISKYPCFLM